jgi:hypothetical protein
MKSPFPGMDPHLEQPGTWSDFHATFYVEIKATLNAILPPGFVARSDQYVWIHEPAANERLLLGKPDTYVAQPGAAGSSPGGTVVAAPRTVVLPAVRREGNRYLKIIDVHRHHVVTVLEVLSPTNKNPGPDREAYLMKRSEYLATGVNLIELDLLRGGQTMPWGDEPPPAGYYAMVCRAWEFPKAGIWAFSVREPLPTIPIPLVQDQVEPELSLQACFERAYMHGRYETEIDYHQPPALPLSGDDARWAAELLATKVSER